MSENEVYHLASIISGEVLGCPLVAYYALAWVYTRNKSWNGYGNPTQEALFAATYFYKISDPSFGGTFMFSGRDLQKQSVKNLLWGARSPPMVQTAVFYCNYDSIHVYAPRSKATGFLSKINRIKIEYQIYTMKLYGEPKILDAKGLMRRLK